MKTQALEMELEEAAINLSSQALMKLSQSPQVKPGQAAIPCNVVAVREDGEVMQVVIPIAEHRVEALRAIRQAGMVGFAMIYDGYISNGCLACKGVGCEHCDHGRVARVDAVIVLVRAQWGYSASRVFAYGYTPSGQFELKADRHVELTGQDAMLYGRFETVWEESLPS